jgi:hypothetical protein
VAVFTITFPEIDVMFIISLFEITAKFFHSFIESKNSFIAEITAVMSIISLSSKDDNVNW